MAKPTKKKGTAPKSRAKLKPRRKAAAPPDGFDVHFNPAKQLKRAARKPAEPPAPLPRTLDALGGPEVLDRLFNLIESRKTADPVQSHSARLLARGARAVAQKFGEEAVECLIEIASGHHSEAVGESADVLYHLLIAWVAAGIQPSEVWAELTKRERLSRASDGSGTSVKRLIQQARLHTTKIP